MRPAVQTIVKIVRKSKKERFAEAVRFMEKIKSQQTSTKGIE